MAKDAGQSMEFGVWPSAMENYLEVLSKELTQSDLCFKKIKML